VSVSSNSLPPTGPALALAWTPPCSMRSSAKLRCRRSRLTRTSRRPRVDFLRSVTTRISG
jgi:hypothetical protein